MKKFTTFIVGPLTFIESDKVETVIVKMGNEVSEMSKDECRELYSLAYDIKFTSAPISKHEPAPENEDYPDVLPSIIVEEGEI